MSLKKEAFAIIFCSIFTITLSLKSVSFGTESKTADRSYWILNAAGVWETEIKNACINKQDNYSHEAIEIKSDGTFEIYCKEKSGSKKRMYQGTYYIMDFGLTEFQIKKKRDNLDISWFDFKKLLHGHFEKKTVKLDINCPEGSYDPICRGKSLIVSDKKVLIIRFNFLEGCNCIIADQKEYTKK